eukprot:scaffold1769_cov132-Skeletonema_dohrnii-CCMP3373.AAC.13
MPPMSTDTEHISSYYLDLDLDTKMKDSSDLEAANFFIAGSYTSNDPTSTSTAALHVLGPLRCSNYSCSIPSRCMVAWVL